MACVTADEIEIRDVDLRYERCRLRDVRAERELLSDIAQRGIDRPLAGVTTDSRWILLDGFKRFRCARKLGMGYVPRASLGANEATCIMAMLRGPAQKPLGFLEEARFLHELQHVHGMSLGEMAAALGRSKSWASMRLSALADMSDAVRDAIFRGTFPAYAFMHIVRPFMRMNGVDRRLIDEFVDVTSGRGFSVREIERLANAYFRGGDEIRREITSGHAVIALNELARANGSAGAVNSRERACLKDLERLTRLIEALGAHASDARLKSSAFRAQAHLMLARILKHTETFTNAARRLHDRCGHT